jgi:hypothetical protein
MGMDKLGGPKPPETAERPDVEKLMAERGFRLVIPEHPEFPGKVTYDGFEALPNYKKAIDRAVAGCRIFFKGVFIFDDFGNDHFARRHAQEELRGNIREKLGEEPAQEYWNFRNNNFLRAGGLQQLMMGSFLDPLGNGLIGIETPQAQRTREIVGRFPKIRKVLATGEYTVSDPKFQWMVDRIASMGLPQNEIVTESTPYRAMTEDEKLGVVRLLDGIARDFLQLVIKNDKTSVSGVGLEPTT